VTPLSEGLDIGHLKSETVQKTLTYLIKAQIRRSNSFESQGIEKGKRRHWKGLVEGNQQDIHQKGHHGCQFSSSGIKTEQTHSRFYHSMNTMYVE